jgi:Protein of unknown function (DUF3800)
MQYILYLDEAGDEGFGKLTTPQNPTGQSRWFGIGGILVSEEQDKKLPQLRNAINKAISPKSDNRKLHFKKLYHEQKVVACQMLAEHNVKIISAFLDKSYEMLETSFAKEKDKNILYASLVSLVVERSVNYCHENNATLKIVFSRRKGSDYNLLTSFLATIKEKASASNIGKHNNAWGSFATSNIEVLDHDNKAGLQLADITISGIFAALNPNYYHNTELTYIKALSSIILKNKGGEIHPMGINILSDFKTLMQTFPNIHSNCIELMIILIKKSGEPLVP